MNLVSTRELHNQRLEVVRQLLPILRRARADHRLSAERLAAEIGVSEKSLLNWEERQPFLALII